jgi:hypothetical protein
VNNYDNVRDLSDILNANIDVIVILDTNYSTENFSYVIELINPQNFSVLMKEEKFTKEIIEEAIQGLVDKKDEVDVQRLARDVDLPKYISVSG